MDFGGILEQRLYHHSYGGESKEEEILYSKPFGLPQGSGGKLVDCGGSFSSSSAGFSFPSKPSKKLPPSPPMTADFTRLSLIQDSNDDVEDEEVSRATTRMERRTSPLPGYFLMHKAGGLLVAPVKQQHHHQQQQQQQRIVQHYQPQPPPPALRGPFTMAPPPAPPAMPLPAWQSLPPYHHQGGSSSSKPASSSVVPSCSVKSGDEGKPRLWTAEEDSLLRRAVEFHQGRNWKLIAESVPNRNSVQCLQRWKHVLHPEVGKGAWTAEEDEQLLRLVGLYGQRWSEIAKHMPRRIGKRCRERWENHLKEGLRKDRWTEEEERVLIDARERLGNRWTDIAKLLEGRGVNQIKNHWYSISRRRAGIGGGPTTATTPPASTASAAPTKPSSSLSRCSLPTAAVLSAPQPPAAASTATAAPPASSSSSVCSQPPAPASSPTPLEASSALLALASGAMQRLAAAPRPSTAAAPTTSSSRGGSTVVKRQLSPRSRCAPPGSGPRPCKATRTAGGPQQQLQQCERQQEQQQEEEEAWTAAEEAVVLIKVREMGRRWSAIASTYLPHRTPHQLRRRFVQHLQRSSGGQAAAGQQQAGEQWSHEDVQLLREAHRRYPGSWLIISRFMGRSEEEVEDQFFALPPPNNTTTAL